MPLEGVFGGHGGPSWGVTALFWHRPGQRSRGVCRGLGSIALVQALALAELLV